MNIQFLGRKVQGYSHKRNGKPCEDNYNYTTQIIRNGKKRGQAKIIDKRYLLSVADGHGSETCPYSEKGSYYATHTFLDVMMGILNEFGTDDARLMAYLHSEGSMSIAKSIDALWKESVEKHYYRHYSDGICASPKDIWHKYGTTLLGLLVTNSFIFAFQLGDGDIVRIDETGVSYVIEAEHILGTETHSISSANAWKHALTTMQSIDASRKTLFLMSTDGFANSYKTTTDFSITCKEYYDIVVEEGFEVIRENLVNWLNETSEHGCGDDTTLALVYVGEDSAS